MRSILPWMQMRGILAQPGDNLKAQNCSACCAGRIRVQEPIRDILLPRLISGNLSVENLDIQFPPGMAKELATEPSGAMAAGNPPAV